MSKIYKVVNGELSDGYHTFSDIYRHRNLLFINMCLASPEKCVWADHQEWDSAVLVYNAPAGQISYHISYDQVPFILHKIKEVKFGEHGWDGHNPRNVLERLEDLAMQK